MQYHDMNLDKESFIYGAIFSLANRMQVIGDKIDPTISVKQWFVLAAVSKFNKIPPNIGDIAQILGTSRQNIKKIANILERKGYMELKKAPNDLRNIQLFLTDSCYDYFKSREKQENEYLESIFSGFDNEMLESLCKNLGKLIENTDGMINRNIKSERQG